MKRISHRDTETPRMKEQKDKEMKSPQAVTFSLSDLVYLCVSASLWLT